MAAANRSPSRSGFLEVTPPGRRQAVEPGAAPVLALAPFRLDEPPALEPLESRIQRALLHSERPRDLLDADQYPVAVQAVQRDRLEEQGVEHAGEQTVGLGHVEVAPISWTG